LWAVSATVALLKRTGTPFLFVVNQATLNANITAQTIAALSHHGPVAQTIIGARVHYAAAMTDGHTAPELAGKGPAAREITALWKNINHTCMNSCDHPRCQPMPKPLPITPALVEAPQTTPQATTAARSAKPPAKPKVEPLQIRLPRDEIYAIKARGAREATNCERFHACMLSCLQKN
jgi:hypothetical protein